MTRVGVFGWGIVAPQAPTVTDFARRLEQAPSWLSPFNGFGPDNFLVGTPAFDFAEYKPWLSSRFPPNRYRQLTEKMDWPTLYAIGAFVQALGQNPGIERLLHELGTACHVYIGSGLGNLHTISNATIALYHAQRKWDRFWADPARNAAYRAWLDGDWSPEEDAVPPEPGTVDAGERDEAETQWWRYWSERSDQLREFLARSREIEELTVEGPVDQGKISLIREKQRRLDRLLKDWGAPVPPWSSVSANVVWNIQNTPASQISMLGKITGLSFAPAGACSTFGLSLKLAMDAIDRGEVKAVVIGATDPPPHPLVVGAFYAARVISASGGVSKPLAGLRGTHVAGGAAIWIVGDLDHFTALGMRPLGMEPVAVGMSSDADHIITPSVDGPIAAIEAAFTHAGARADEIGTWDLHATATPGDYLEVENLRRLLPERVVVTARKGTFGHGMGPCGGWELTAQYLGFERGRLFPTPLAPGELNPEIAKLHTMFTFDSATGFPAGLAGKLNMGVGGINACVLSRPYRVPETGAQHPGGDR
ncbi:MAG: beta-ketoacyl synthase N-terminal-like domain-containing protein [Gemmatimonadota bacterium]